MRPGVDLTRVLARLERWGAERSWVGPDPYEGLNTALGRHVRGRRPRQAVIQAYKRLPFAPVPPLRAPRTPNSKALALALSGYSTPAGSELPGAGEWLKRLPAMIEELNLGGTDAAWGYHFDAQTRHLFYARETPNAVATCFVAGALLDLHSLTGEDRPAQLAMRARPFLMSLLKRDRRGRPFFAYVSAGSELIHNANVMVAGTLARIHVLDPDQASVAAASEAVETTLALQPEGGIWPYGERGDLGWADNFHTAYIIEGLARIEAVVGIGAAERAAAVEAWRRRFFGPLGEARFYPDQEFPLEAHSYASAIDCLCTTAQLEPRRRDELLDFASAVAMSAIATLWLEREGRFAFRRTSRGTNRREFMRWTNAPMFCALARLHSAVAS